MNVDKNTENEAPDPFFAKGCLGLVAIGLGSILGAMALVYAARMLFGL